MSKSKTKRQPATVATAETKGHSDQRMVRRCAELQKRLEYSSIEASFAIDQRDKLWTALDELLNTAAVISTERDPECFVDLQTLRPKYLAAYKALEAVKPPAQSEIERLRKRCSELHRRCQQAEAAVADFKRQWDKHGGPRGGSFGRALLACECVRLVAVIEETIEDNAHLADGDNCTLIKLKRAIAPNSVISGGVGKPENANDVDKTT